MFGKRVKQNKSHDEDNCIVRIKTYAPNQSVSAQDYVIPSDFVAFEEGFDALARTAFEKINADPYCRHFMDQVIDKMGEAVIVEYRIQRANHQSTINTIVTNNEGEIIKATSKLEQNLADQENVSILLHQLESIYYKDTAYERFTIDTETSKEGNGHDR